MTRAWKWVNARTGTIIDVDLWWLILDKIKNNYPTAWDAQELLKPLDRRYLLRNEIGWGYSDQNFEEANLAATFNVTHNNSPQRSRWVGGGRRRILQFVITEFSYKHDATASSDTYSAPPYRYMATKNIFENMLSTNSLWLTDIGVNFIAEPSVVQDGKNFGNFGLVNNFQAPINLFSDNFKWRYVLLWQMEILEDLT